MHQIPMSSHCEQKFSACDSLHHRATRSRYPVVMIAQLGGLPHDAQNWLLVPEAKTLHWARLGTFPLQYPLRSVFSYLLYYHLRAPLQLDF